MTVGFLLTDWSMRSRKKKEDKMGGLSIGPAIEAGVSCDYLAVLKGTGW